MLVVSEANQQEQIIDSSARPSSCVTEEASSDSDTEEVILPSRVEEPTDGLKPVEQQRSIVPSFSLLSRLDTLKSVCSGFSIWRSESQQQANQSSHSLESSGAQLLTQQSTKLEHRSVQSTQQAGCHQVQVSSASIATQSVVLPDLSASSNPYIRSSLSPAMQQPSHVRPAALSDSDPMALQVAQPVYSQVSPRRDYVSDMKRVATAAYTRAYHDASRHMLSAQLAARMPSQPIIIQNTTKAVAESQSEVKGATQPPKRSVFERCLNFLQSFWSSKLNRLLVIGLAGAGVYLYWEFWTQHKRMQLMKRRIEANPLLRLGQIISGAADGQRSNRLYSNGNHYY